MLKTLWLAMAAMSAAIPALIGWFALIRGGCHLYTNYDVDAARENCTLWCSLLPPAVVAFYLLSDVSAQGATIAAIRSWNLSSMQTFGVVTGFVILTGVADSILAKLAFWAGKRFKYNKLCRQTLKQRVKCRNEGASACIQPQPCRCPIGLKRPLGSVQEAEIKQLIEEAKPVFEALDQTSATTEAGEAKTSPMPCVFATASFYPYYPPRTVRVSATVAKELEAINASFRAATKQSKKSA